MLDTRTTAVVGPPAPGASLPPVSAPRVPFETRSSQDEVDTTVRTVLQRLTGSVPPRSRNPDVLREHSSGSSYRTRSTPFIVDGIRPEDLTGGQANDCYLIATLSAIAAVRPELIEEIIRPNADGTYTARFFDLDQGVPVQITVDGATPVGSNGQPLYAEGTDAWGPLIEKAYAVRYGGYTRMGERGGVAQYAMAEITGRVAGGFRTSIGVTATLRALETAIRERRPMLAQTNASALSGCGVSRRGIVDNHSYAVLGVERTTDGVYVTLRDPMGASEYRNRRYDTDYAIPPNSPRRGDGVFRMRIQDFTRHFFNVVTMTDTPLRRPEPSVYTLPPAQVVTVSHITRANPRRPTPVCRIPD